MGKMQRSPPMAAPELSSMPESFAAGTTVKYTKRLTDYPASQGWTAVLHLAGPEVLGPTSGTVSGDNFIFTLSSTVTGALQAGTYRWREIVTKSGETFIADAGVVRVDADITQAVSGDFQDKEEQWLGAVEARLAGRLESDLQSYGVVGRQVLKIPIDQLFDLRASLKRAVAARQRPGRFDQTILGTFVTPGDER